MPVGQGEALEAGAPVARMSDSTSGWDSPAGMAAMTRGGIGASASFRAAQIREPP